MARNLAHIVILLYAVWLIHSSNRVLLLMLRPRLSEKAFGFLRRGSLNRYLLLSAKNETPPLFFRWNLIALSLFGVHVVLTVLLGWFSFLDVFMRILNSVTILCLGGEAFLLSMVQNQMSFGQPCVLYRPLPNETRLFASTVVDAALYVVVPVFVMICNILILTSATPAA